MTGKKFKAAREAMGLSVSALADLLDVNRSTIFRIEQTECTRVMALAMERLAQIFALSNGLDDHFPSGLRQRSYQIANVGEVIEGRVCVDCYCGASFSAADEGEARQLWASHALELIEQKHD